MSYYYDAALDLESEIDNYAMPVLGGAAELASLIYHTKYVNMTDKPSQFNQALDKLEVMYRPAGFVVPNNFISDSKIEEKILNLDTNSSPGYPFAYKANNNKKLIEKLGMDVLVDIVRERLEQLISCFDSFGQYDEATLILSNPVKYRELIQPKVRLVCDPVRLFVKQEPHKQAKLDLLRFRLIHSVSVIDQIIDALILDDSLNAEKSNFSVIPSKVGMSFFGEDFHNLISQFNNDIPTKIKTDKSSYDWTKPWWSYIAKLELRKRLCLNVFEDHITVWLKLHYMRYNCLMFNDIILTDGRVYQRLYPCIQASGGKATISDNSSDQAFYKILANITNNWNEYLIASMGDDTIEDFVGDTSKLVDTLTSYGVIIKDVPELIDYINLDFCSSSVGKYRGRYYPIPLNWKKHVAGLKLRAVGSKDVLMETLASLSMMYVLTDKWGILQKCMFRLSQTQPEKAHLIKSREWCINHLIGYLE